MTEEPTYIATVLSWIINAVFAIALFIGRMTFQRSMQKQDDIEKRLRYLERESVTHADLQRLEDKLEKMIDRMDRILESRA